MFQILLAHIGNITVFFVLRQQVIEGLLLCRANRFRTRFPPFFRIGEFGVHVENHASKVKQPVPNPISNREPTRYGSHRCHSLLSLLHLDSWALAGQARCFTTCSYRRSGARRVWYESVVSCRLWWGQCAST